MRSSIRYKNLKRLLLYDLAYWLFCSLFVIIAETYKGHTFKTLNLSFIFIGPAFLIIPLTIVQLGYFLRDKTKNITCENDKIIYIKNGLQLEIHKQDIINYHYYTRFFFSDLTVYLHKDMRLRISNSHDDFKTALKQIKDWNIPVRLFYKT